MTSPADTLYRLLLRALPREVRHDFGEDMVQMFRDYRRDQRGRPIGLIALWAAAIGDVAAQAARARSATSVAGRTDVRSAGQAAGVFMRSVSFDIRHGFRLLRHYPATSLLALVTLALGIGANTAIFSVIDTVLLRSLPYPEPDRVVMMLEQRPKESASPSPASPADFLDWRSRNVSFATMAAYAPQPLTVTGLGEPRQITAGLVSAGFFDVLRTRPEVGRTFVPADEVVGQTPAFVLSHSFWQ